MTPNAPDASPPSTAGLRPHWRVRLRSLGRDFFLIVAGVLTALALENWNGSLRDRDLEGEYLRALSGEVRAHVAQYDEWLETFDRNQRWTATIWGWANGAAPRQRTEEVLLWMRLGGQFHPNTQFQDGAYQDLVSSGRLSLIRNRSLREAVVNYYASLRYWAGAVESSGYRAAERYGTAVAGLIPPPLAWRAVMDEDMSGVDLTAVLSEFRGRPAVRDALVGMAESYSFQIDMAKGSRDRSLALFEQLETELVR